MQNEKILFSDVFKEGWRLTKANLGFLCGYTALFLLLMLLIEYAPYNENHPTLYGVVMLFVLGIPYVGLYRSAILLIDGTKPKFSEFYSNWKLLGPSLLASILLGLMFMILAIIIVLPIVWMTTHNGAGQDGSTVTTQQVLIIGLGVIALLVPAVWLSIRFLLFPYYIVDTNSGAIESLKKSYRDTQGHGWLLFKTLLVAWLLSLLNLLTFGLASIIVLPLMILVIGVIYRKLTGPGIEVISTQE